jgi:hypothetical protein
MQTLNVMYKDFGAFNSTGHLVAAFAAPQDAQSTWKDQTLQVSTHEAGVVVGLGASLTTLNFGRWLRLIPAALLLLAGAAQAQSHSTESGSYLLRSTTVASEQIDAEAAQRHGVVPARDRAVVNVVLLRRDGAGAYTTVPARVTVSMHTMSSYSSNIEMSEVRENGGISYLGSYEFLPRQMINFEVLAAPTEDAQQQPLTLDYRERMWSH